jgi:hypothetical protein
MEKMEIALIHLISGMTSALIIHFPAKGGKLSGSSNATLMMKTAFQRSNSNGIN